MALYSLMVLMCR